jgi:hypothetical protein
MYLNPNSLLFVESVGPNSNVAELIAQAQHPLLDCALLPDLVFFERNRRLQNVVERHD